MEGIPLKRFKRDLDDTETDIKKCIIARRAQAKHFQVLKLDGKGFWRQQRFDRRMLMKDCTNLLSMLAMNVTNDTHIKSHLTLIL